MENERVYIGKVEALEYCLDKNIDELPSLNHSISSNLSIKEQKETGISSYNIGKDAKGYFLSSNQSYLV